MPGDDEEVLVVSRKILFPHRNYHFEGFREVGEGTPDYEKIIERNFQTMLHKDASKEFHFKQPIAYVAVFNLWEEKFFMYQRALKNGERGLLGKLSVGFGGHMNPVERVKGGIRKSLAREVGKETGLGERGFIEVQPVGFINDESNDVNAVHFGLLYLAVTSSSTLSPQEEEIARWWLTDLDTMKDMKRNPEYNIETWTKIALEHLGKLL